MYVHKKKHTEKLTQYKVAAKENKYLNYVKCKLFIKIIKMLFFFEFKKKQITNSRHETAYIHTCTFEFT